MSEGEKEEEWEVWEGDFGGGLCRWMTLGNQRGPRREDGMLWEK